MSIPYVFADAAVVAKRNLIKIKRVPDLLVFTTLQPIMFVLLFAYVFGGAISQADGGAAYREFLIAGIFAQTVVFGATITGAGIAEDVQKGIIDRFRTLPMSPSAVLAALAAYLLLLAFAYAISWIMAWIGLIVPSPEVVNNAAFVVIFPLTFVANTFVPTRNFPTVLKAFANWNPVSAVTQAARELFGNTSALQ